jgi:hypothetical protein
MERIGAIVIIRSSVRIHAAAVWCEGGRPDRQSMATQGDTGRQIHKPSSHPSDLSERGRFNGRADDGGRTCDGQKAARFGISGMKPGKQPVHRCG